MNLRFVSRFLLLLPAAAALGAGTPATKAVSLDAYVALGSSFAHDNRLHQLGWSEAQREAFLQGIRATFEGTPRALDAEGQALLQAVGLRLQELAQQDQRRPFGAQAFAQPGFLDQYLKEMRKRFDLQGTDSGLSFGIKVIGAGARPAPEDTVIISYKVSTADLQTELKGLGGERVRLKMDDLVPGLAEALQMMNIGSTALLILPPDLSFGEGPWPAGAERGTPLVFTVILHEIIAAP